MSRQLADLEIILQQLVNEHRKLLGQLDVQQEAMTQFRLSGIEDATHLQEATRLRIVALDNRRRNLVQQIARAARIDGDLSISQLAQLYPPRRDALLKLKNELTEVIQQIAARTHVAGRLAGAVLGHLNTVVRIFAGAVEKAGVYTKQGVPQVTARIGVMEAVG
jgi:hypothetical protein